MPIYLGSVEIVETRVSVVNECAGEAISLYAMRRPLIRHLSEGGGGASDNAGTRRQQSMKEDERGSYTWNCREYGHHLSSCDLLKVPTALSCRGQTTSPEPRIALHR